MGGSQTREFVGIKNGNLRVESIFITCIYHASRMIGRGLKKRYLYEELFFSTINPEIYNFVDGSRIRIVIDSSKYTKKTYLFDETTKDFLKSCGFNINNMHSNTLYINVYEYDKTLDTVYLIKEDGITYLNDTPIGSISSRKFPSTYIGMEIGV